MFLACSVCVCNCQHYVLLYVLFFCHVLSSNIELYTVTIHIKSQTAALQCTYVQTPKILWIPWHGGIRTHDFRLHYRYMVFTVFISTRYEEDHWKTNGFHERKLLRVKVQEGLYVSYVKQNCF
jgi:hypothetical protein